MTDGGRLVKIELFAKMVRTRSASSQNANSSPQT